MSNITQTLLSSDDEHNATAKQGILHIEPQHRAVLQQKLHRLLSSPITDLKIVTDFDATLSSPGHASSWRVLEHNPFVTPEYRERGLRLAQQYYPIEIDPSLDLDTKCQYMVEWWFKAQMNIRNERITRKQYREILKYGNEAIRLRHGCDEMFKLTYKYDIPLLIFSAGIGDAIDHVMLQFDTYTSSNVNYLDPDHPRSKIHQKIQKEIAYCDDQNDLMNSNTTSLPPSSSCASDDASAAAIPDQKPLSTNISIFANHFKFSPIDDVTGEPLYDQPVVQPRDTDVISGFIEDPIHVFNKHEDLLIDTPLYKQFKDRHNVLLLGDSLGDATMVKSKSDNIIRIGYLNTSMSKTVADQLPSYISTFDIVLVDDDTVYWANKVLLAHLYVHGHVTTNPFASKTSSDQAMVFNNQEEMIEYCVSCLLDV